MNYLNRNGLVDGRIPPKTPCFWLDNCRIKDFNCPTVESLKNKAFSCGMARLFSMTEGDKNYVSKN